MNPFVLAILFVSAGPPFQAQTLDGRLVSGTLSALSTQRATLATDAGPVELATEKLLTIASKGEPKPAASDAGITVDLSDGSVIRARQYTASAKEARITLANGTVVTAPAGAVRSVRLQRGSADLETEWTQLTAKSVDSDVLIVRVENAIDYHKGVLDEVTDDVVRFSIDGEPLPVKRAKVFGFVRHQSKEAELPSAVCRISDASGSKWAVRTLELKESLQWTTPVGLAITQPLESIIQIDFSAGKLAYVSDLKPENIVWTPYFGGETTPATVKQFFAPRFDRGFQTSELRMAGNEYSKGVALHSRTELVYRLPERFGRFRAVAGIDDAARPRGKVRLVIRGDDRVLFDAVIVGTEPPRDLDLDLSGVRRLVIVTDFADTPPVGDLLLLCDARVLK